MNSMNSSSRSQRDLNQNDNGARPVVFIIDTVDGLVFLLARNTIEAHMSAAAYASFHVGCIHAIVPRPRDYQSLFDACEAKQYNKHLAIIQSDAAIEAYMHFVD